MVCAEFLVAVVPKVFQLEVEARQDSRSISGMPNVQSCRFVRNIQIRSFGLFQLRVDAFGASFEMYVPLEIIVGTVPLRSTIRPIPQSPRHDSRSRGHHSTSSQATSHSEHYAGEIKNNTKETECRVNVSSCC